MSRCVLAFCAGLILLLASCEESLSIEDGVFLVSYEFVNDTQYDCIVKWDYGADVIIEKEVVIIKGDSYTQVVRLGVMEGVCKDGSLPIIKAFNTQLVFSNNGTGDDMSYTITRDSVGEIVEGVEWTQLPKSESIIGNTNKYLTIQRFYLSDIYSISQEIKQ